MTSTAVVARPQRQFPRLFPTITADLYTQADGPEAPTPDRQAAIAIVALAHRELTQAQLLFARHLTSLDHLARLLIQHRLGFEAELAAQWQRADFYWQQVQNQLTALTQQACFWPDLSTALAKDHPQIEAFKDPEGLRQRLVEELLIDTHCGFYNGLNSLQPATNQAVGGPADRPSVATVGDRSFAHITWIEGLLPQSSLVREQWLLLLDAPWQRRCDRLRAEQNWRAADQLCRHRLRLYPATLRFQTELAEVAGAAVLADLKSGESEAQYRANARRLKQGIRQFETLAKTYPHNLAIYDYLGDLHHLYAIQLGNAGEVAAGLVAVETALTYAPQLKAAPTTRTRLSELMQQIQAQTAQLLADLRRRPNARLNAKGLQLKVQAQKGFTLRDKFLNSPQVGNIQAAVRLAQAMAVWHSLSDLPPKPTEAQALALYEGLTRILQQPPPDKSCLPDDWQRFAEAHPELKDLPPEPVHRFLEQRLWKTPKTSPIVTPPPSSTKPMVLCPTQTTPQPSREPLLPWLFSRQNLGLKTEMAGAIAALLVAGGLGLYDLSVRSTRTRAYAQILTAAQADQPLTVMENAERFLAQTPLSGRDGREPQVKQLYTQAFVSWFLQQPEMPEDAILQRHVQRYQQLVKH